MILFGNLTVTRVSRSELAAFMLTGVHQKIRFLG